MTPEQLAEIKARRDAASLGPWNTDGPHWWSTRDCTYVITTHPERAAIAVMASKDEVADPDMRKANAEFIAHSRQDVDDLLAEVERLTAKTAELRLALSPTNGRLYDHIGYLRKQVERLTAQVTAMAEENTRLVAEVDKLREALARLTASLEGGQP